LDFQLTAEQHRLQNKCRELATDFATRAAAHDRDASHPVENYDRLREEEFLALTVGEEWGGLGASFLDHTLAYEVLAQGCPSTALAFNMHISVVMPLLQSAEVSTEAKRRIADLVVRQRKLIAGNFSEPVTTALIGERPLKARVSRADGGYRITGRKMFASMLEAADFVLVMAYPDWVTSPAAGIILMLPRGAEGRSVDPNWDVIGMRATRSDSLILDACWLPESAAVFCSDDTRPFRHAYLNWFWGSYTPIYLGVAQAAFDELRKVVQTRQPEGYAQPLAYHPDVRRHVAEMSANLEAARLITYRSAWLSDTEGPTEQTTAALYRAKYMVGQAVSSITRTALTLGGAHGIFKTSRLEQLFRDGALGPLHPPPSDFCLYNMGLLRAGHRPRRCPAADETGVVKPVSLSDHQDNPGGTKVRIRFAPAASHVRTCADR
jgi:alkylation response protein AidB-like acyl-CoA dehydrogenase